MHSWVVAHLPALNMGLPFLQNLQLLHLSLGLVDAGAHSLHHLQRLLHQGIVVVLPRGPFQQLLHMHTTQSLLPHVTYIIDMTHIHSDVFKLYLIKTCCISGSHV